MMTKRLYFLLCLMMPLTGMAQSTLELTANESFFSPVGTLLAVEDPSQTGTMANNNLFFTHITNWKVTTDTIFWGVDIVHAGALVITPVCGLPSGQVQSTLDIIFGGQSQTRSLTAAGGYDDFRAQESVVFEVPAPGRYLVGVTLNTVASPGTNVADVQKLVLSGPAANEASVVIRRWRPFAVHSRWESSENPAEPVLAIHKNRIATRHIDMYQPITTPFGYYGSTWSTDNQRFNVLNFSLWSYGQHDPVPPVDEFSHLIAVGKGQEFGEYGHEGTGVKPRGPSPWLDHDVHTQVIALRMEPGTYYDTYYSYYLDPSSLAWKFFGAGKKYNASGHIRYLTTGAFVEQPGAPDRRRCNHVMREVHFQGWLMDNQGQWYNIDRMIPGGSLSNISYKNWGVTEDYYFSMQMGGLGENNHQPSQLVLEGLPPVDQRPDYLKGEKLLELFKLPATIDTLAPQQVNTTSAVVQFDIQEVGNNAGAELFWGQQEGLTFDYRWENSREINLSDGVIQATIEGLVPRQTYRYRLRITNDEGITWSMHTQSFETQEPTDVYADFAVSRQAIFTGQSVVFTNKSFPENASLQWYFPGGSPSSSVQQNPVVTYNQAGVFDVSLTVTSADGQQQDVRTLAGCISVSEIQQGDNLDVYIDFRKNLYDLSGNKRHGYVAGKGSDHGDPDADMPYVYDQKRGWVGSFGGSTEVELTDYYGVEGSRSRTMTAWVKTTHNDMVIVNWGRAQAGKKNTLKIDANGYLRFEVASGFVIASTTLVNDGQWHHIACVLEESASPNVADVRLYVNGQQEQFAATPRELITEKYMLATIGNDFFKKYYSGLMSDVRIYSRALSQESLQSMIESDPVTYIEEPVKQEMPPDWVTVRQLPGHQVEIELSGDQYAELSVYDMMGGLIRQHTINPGTNHLYRPGNRKLAILIIRSNHNHPVAEKLFW